MIKKLLPIALPIAFFALVNIASANLTQLELQPQSSFTCNATGTIYYSLSNNQLMLCTSGNSASPVLTSSGSSGTGASFSTLTVSGQTTLATASGKVGIGTGSPTAELTVNGDISVGRISDSSGVLLSTSSAVSDLGFYNTRNGFWTRIVTNSAPINFFTDGSSANGYVGGTPMVTFNNNGYVGIGTTSPGTNLDVNGNINVGSVLYDRANTNYYLNPSGNIMPYALNAGGSIDIPQNQALRAAGNWLMGQDSSTETIHIGSTVVANDIRFDSSSGAGIAIIKANGSVGIGTTAPGAKLEVTGPMLDSNGGSILHYRNVLHYYVGGGTHTGTLEIIMPNSWNNTMMQMTIRGYDYANNNGAWEARVGGYNYQPNSAWYNYSAQISGRAPFSSVRLAYDSSLSKNVILLGTTGTPWNYEAIDVSDFIASYGSQSGWGGGWSAALLTSEANIADVSAPAIDIFDSGGNIGIGTTGPGGTLDVNGNLVLSAASHTGGADYYLSTTGSGGSTNVYNYIGNYGQGYFWQLQSGVGNSTLASIIGNPGGSNNATAAGQLNLYNSASTPSGQAITVQLNGNTGANSYFNAGKVSIGTSTAPDSNSGLLVANGDIAIPNASDVNNNYAATVAYVKSAVAGGSGSSVGYWTLSGSNLYTNSTSYNVGIDTTSPGYPLSVNSGSNSVGLQVVGADSTGWAGRGIFGGATAYVVLGEYNTSNVYIGGHNAALNAWYPIHINPSANIYLAEISGTVGIGTASPAGNMKLDVEGGALLGGQIYVSPTNYNTLNSGYSSGNDMWINYRGLADGMTQYRNFNVGDGEGGNIAWFSGSNHYVGINTGQTAATALDVNGNVQASIFYDRDNTNYYLDPAANTMPYAANLNGDIVQDGNFLSSIGAWTTVSTTTNWYTVGYLSGGRGYGEFLVENTQSSQHQVIKFIASIQYGNGAQITVLQNSDFANMPFTAIRIAQLSTNVTYGAYAVQVYGNDLYGTGNANRVRMMNQGHDGWVIYNFTTAENANYVATVAQVSLTQASMVESGNLAVGGSMYSIEHDNGTATGATTINWLNGNTQTLVLGASPIALTFNNGQPGGHYTLALKQDATGSRLVTWPGNVRWSSGVAPTLTTTANKTDYVEFVYDGLSSTFDGVGFNANF
ncbi:MAG: hypothetical protein M1604_04035 [Patescibacteria group bacterium]|nr:hypothetical protein [Patescibacteria group bacterium]